MKITTTDILAALVLAYLVASNWGGLPDILPQPEVESPFPADGFYLLAASESSELSGLELAISAEDIRNIEGLQRRWADFDKIQPEPGCWQDAVEWAESRGGGSPYFVARHGGKAAEGKLAGSVDEMHTTIVEALEGLQ